MSKVAAVDVFCGAGGLAFGLKSAGLRIAAGIDLDPHCKFPFEKNCHGKFIERDISCVDSADINKLFGSAKFRVLAGCAPCQPFSTYSQSRKSPDTRWRLLNEFERLAIETTPEIVTMENVPRLATQPVWRKFITALRSAGYWVSWKEVSCRDYGIPQSRKRLVLLASTLGPIELDQPSLATVKCTVRGAIEYLPSLGNGEASVSDPLHAASRLSSLNLKRIRASQPGGTWRDWPPRLRSQCHIRKSGETYPAVYGRMEWDEPAPTITTQFYGFGNGRFGHPVQDRAITIREAALLQSFPPNYLFVEDDDDITFRRLGILIGNAVPPKLGEAIGQSIIKHVSQAAKGIK